MLTFNGQSDVIRVHNSHTQQIQLHFVQLVCQLLQLIEKQNKPHNPIHEPYKPLHKPHNTKSKPYKPIVVFFHLPISEVKNPTTIKHNDSSKLRTHNNKSKNRTLLQWPWCYTHYNTHLHTYPLSIQRTQISYLTQNDTFRARVRSRTDCKVTTPNSPSSDQDYHKANPCSDHEFHKPTPCNTHKQTALQ